MLTEDQIQFLNRVCTGKWTETNGVINVDGYVNMDSMNLTEIPVQFGQVIGHFNCSGNKLTSLLGCPSIVEQYFDCDSNRLTSLEGGPTEVAEFYSCSYNALINLIGTPEICNGNFYCHHNQLTSLEGCPKLINGYLYCRRNVYLKYIWGIGCLKDNISYTNKNELNEWIRECARRNVIFPYLTFEENIKWIKDTNNYQLLLGAPKKIKKLFSPYIINGINNNLC